MGLEQRIMIGTEMSCCAPIMKGGIAHPAEAGAIDGPTMHAEANDAARELVHDHEHPAGPFGPGVLGRWLDENKRRYLRPTSAR